MNSCFRSSFGPRRCWRRDCNVPSVVTIRRVSVSHRGIHVHFGLTIANGGMLRIHHPARRHPVGEHFIVSAATLSLAPRERVASNPAGQCNHHAPRKSTPRPSWTSRPASHPRTLWINRPPRLIFHLSGVERRLDWIQLFVLRRRLPFCFGPTVGFGL